MSCEEVRDDQTAEGLAPIQAAIVEAMLAGNTITDAAAEAGVNRHTVHRWLKGDFAFQAALNRGRRETYRAASRNL